MSSVRHKLFALALLAAVVGGLSLLGPHATRGGDTGALDDPGLVDNRLWVDGRPEKHTDYVHAAIFISRANFGLFERASSYDVRFEFFDMTRDPQRITLTFPQTNRSATIGFSVKACDEKKPFDLCLDLTSNPWGGPKRYYGFSQPEQERAQLGDVADRLRADAQRP
jgi:hypothetical protein